MEERRADVFVRRLIERVGLRRQRLFAAQPEVAERLLGLSRLAELATAWARREPHGSTRDFVRLPQRRRRGRRRAGRGRGAAGAGVGAGDGARTRSRASSSTTSSCSGSRARPTGSGSAAGPHRARPLPGRARRARARRARPRFYGQALAATGGEEEEHDEELFGPAEGLHATYRRLREEVLEASWQAGRELSEPRLDTAIDVNRAIARYLELLKLAALAQRPGDEATAEAIEAVNGLLRQVATPEQQAELDASALDSYLLDSERERDSRRRADRRPPRALAGGLPAAPRRRRAQPLGLRPRPLPDLPAEVQVRPRLRHPPGADDQPALRDPHPQRPRALPQGSAGGRARTGCGRLNDLFETGWRRTGFGSTDDELQFRDRAREAMRLYWERERDSEGEPVWLERKFDFKIGEHHVRGRVDRVDRLPGRRLRADRLQDRRAQERSRAGERPAAGALPARRPRGLGHRGQHRQLLLRARRRQGRGADQARRRRAGRAHRAPGRRGRPRPGLRAAPLADRLQLVRLPADLPGGRVLTSPLRARNLRRFAAPSALVAALLEETLELAGDGVGGGQVVALARPAGRPARPRSARPAPRSRGWRRRRGRSALRSRRFPPPARRPRRRSRSGPRAGAAAPAPPSGWGPRRRSGAPPPRARPSSCRAWRQRSWTTPTMPVGPS